MRKIFLHINVPSLSGQRGVPELFQGTAKLKFYYHNTKNGYAN